jgi:Cu/Ag efflux protein CusF
MNTLKQWLCLATLAVAPLAHAAELADGEVRKIDRDAKKITLKHGEIKSIDMPPMTMVFQVRNPALLDAVKPGDKVKFAVEMDGTAMVVTEISAVT